eukprot:6245415-Prymnesium_polylepis.1
MTSITRTADDWCSTDDGNDELTCGALLYRSCRAAAAGLPLAGGSASRAAVRGRAARRPVRHCRRRSTLAGACRAASRKGTAAATQRSGSCCGSSSSQEQQTRAPSAS